VLFYPELPPPYSVARKMVRVLGCVAVESLNTKHDVAFLYQDATFVDQSVANAIRTCQGGVINGLCLDISKKKVESVHEEVFGYALGVDPLDYEGPVVVKPNRNGTAEGRIINTPIRPAMMRDDMVYQKAIGYSGRHSHCPAAYEYRVPIYLAVPRLVYIKVRKPGDVLKSRYRMLGIKEPADVFSKAELRNLSRLAHDMGLDYGELDVLRDTDGRIYVIDVNTTPLGLSGKSMSADLRVAAGERLQQGFSDLLQHFT
jgi:hypothetical protein